VVHRSRKACVGSFLVVGGSRSILGLFTILKSPVRMVGWG